MNHRHIVRSILVLQLCLASQAALADTAITRWPLATIDLDSQIHRQVVVDRQAGQYLGQAADVHLCEPGCIRSPDGTRLAVLLRENSRRKNSHVIFSDDEGQTWNQPREVPLALTGDRHTGKYAPDGRLFISFRCISPTAKRATRPFEGDWVAWVGTWDDIVNGRDGQYSVRLKDNTKSYDTSYPGVEVLSDGTFVATTYGHWVQGESPYILSVRLKLKELDALARHQP